MVKSRLLSSGLLAAALVVGTTAQGNAQTTYSLNISSSVTASCIGGLYSLQTCEAVRFTLDIPSTQVLNSTGEVIDGGGNPATGGTFTNFALSTFTLNGTSQWQFYTPSSLCIGGLSCSLLAASPGSWFNVTTSSLQTLEVTGSAPLAPITFDVRFSTFQTTLAGISGMSAHTTGNQATEIGGLNRTNLSWSSPTDVTTTVPEPITMLLLGTGLAGVGGAARRRKKRLEIENA